MQNSWITSQHMRLLFLHVGSYASSSLKASTPMSSSIFGFTTCNLDEAKISHEQLCSMIGASENKVIGPQGTFIPQIIAIFAEVLWAGNNLATQETPERMIKLLNKFRRELQPSVFSDICAILPLPQLNRLRAVFSSQLL